MLLIALILLWHERLSLHLTVENKTYVSTVLQLRVAHHATCRFINPLWAPKLKSFAESFTISFEESFVSRMNLS